MKEAEVQILHEKCNLNDNNTKSIEAKSTELAQSQEKKRVKKKKKSPIAENSTNSKVEPIAENCTNSKGKAIAKNCTELQKKMKIKAGTDNLENCTNSKGDVIAENCTGKKLRKKKIKVGSDNLEIDSKSSNENCTETSTVTEIGTDLQVKKKKRKKNDDDKNANTSNDNLDKEDSISKEVVGTVSETGTGLQAKKKKKKADKTLEIGSNNTNTNIESKSNEENSISNEEVLGTITEAGTDLQVKKKKKKADKNLEAHSSNTNNLDVNKSSEEKSISKEEITETGTNLHVKKKKKKIDNSSEVDLINNNNNLEIHDNNANIESKLSEEKSVSKEKVVGTVNETGTELQAKKRKTKKKVEKCENKLDLDSNDIKSDNTNTEANTTNINININNSNVDSKSIEENCNLKEETLGTFETGTEEETGTNSQGKKRKRMKKSTINQEIVPKTKKNKLLVLDINGLLADINSDYKFADIADTKIKGKLVFKRPFCDEFLNFCFDNFEVGIWSSRMKHNVDEAVQFLMGNKRNNLLFCWDQSYCTQTKFNTIENAEKPVVFKELRKIWEKEYPGLVWQKGQFGPNNTLLIDDSPYKALCNPPFTAIFPKPYSFKDKDDNSLGEGGDLRVYLEKILSAQNVQYFVKDNMFGQPAITDSDPHWKYYIQIIDSLNKPFIKRF